MKLNLWNNTLNTLNNRLSNLYFTTDEIRKVLWKAAIDPGEIRFTGAARTDWYNVLYYINNTQEVPLLLQTITGQDERGKNDEFLKGILQNWSHELQPVQSPALRESDKTKIKAAEPIEKLMGLQSTLMPISFLEKGLHCAKAVVRIQIGRTLGSGFLVSGNYIITNHHVIPDENKANLAQIQFNYQTNIEGSPLPIDVWHLDVTAPWATDKTLDYAIFCLQGNANSKYGQLMLADTTPQVNDFVNIIQHPMGGPKQIALYHNVVTYADDNLLHYLTDTLPGSSGSPVFNSDWQVVALHRAGGELSEPDGDRTIVRNAGTNIRWIRQALASLA